MVDRLERELAGQARVARLSVLDAVGRDVAQQYGVRAVPTFLIFDGQGELIGRQTGMPEREQIKGMVTS